jgi:hypothetical protein
VRLLAIAWCSAIFFIGKVKISSAALPNYWSHPSLT